MLRFTKHFIAILIVVALFELMFFFHRAMECNLVFDINAVDAITIWATVLTIVFLVFSILGLLNIDGRIKELKLLSNNRLLAGCLYRTNIDRLKQYTRRNDVAGIKADRKPNNNRYN